MSDDPRRSLEIPNALKSGWKSSEFWLHVLAQILAFVVAFGLMTNEKADTIFKYVGAAITAIVSVAGAVFYGINRTTLKQ